MGNYYGNLNYLTPPSILHGCLPEANRVAATVARALGAGFMESGGTTPAARPSGPIKGVIVIFPYGVVSGGSNDRDHFPGRAQVLDFELLEDLLAAGCVTAGPGA